MPSVYMVWAEAAHCTDSVSKLPVCALFGGRTETLDPGLAPGPVLVAVIETKCSSGSLSLL